jgi:hypothetical protein
MKHVGYDADTEVNTYRDLHGNLWETRPGNQYSPLRLAYRATKGQKSVKSGLSSPTPKDSDTSSPANSTMEHTKKGSNNIFERKRNSSNSSISDRTPAPPPYSHISRRFTSFDMLDQRLVTQERTPESQGVSGVLGA